MVQRCPEGARPQMYNGGFLGHRSNAMPSMPDFSMDFLKQKTGKCLSKLEEHKMGIITISRGSYSKGKETAENLARELGYECVSRDILLEASTHFNIPEVKLVRAIHDAPSFFDRFQHGKEKYILFIREAFLEHILKDNVVYHGLAGHFLLQGIPHVLKVRIIASLEDRVREEMKRERISADEARKILTRDDEERRKWSLHLYGIDTRDPSLYDLVLHVKTMTVEDAVSTVERVLELPAFRTTPESQEVLDQLVSAAAEKAARS